MKKLSVLLITSILAVQLYGCGSAPSVNKIIDSVDKESADITIGTDETGQTEQTEQIEQTEQEDIQETEDYSMLGVYTASGYQNDYFGYQINLPSEYQLNSRAAFSSGNEDVVSESNNETTLSWLKTNLNLSNATVFDASTDMDFISVLVESPGIIADCWDEEETIANNSLNRVIEALESLNDEDITVSEISAQVDYLDNFIDGTHYAVMYMCLINDTPYYGIEIYVRSADAKYLSVFDFSSFEAEGIERICGYCTVK